ncbi:MAG TPA: CRTAC1 family protein [Candidatus Sulfotelmatobacter sp.]|nr:CRTAC1 family protein [Candidatus Sulfotelmatobacter sp.]
MVRQPHRPDSTRRLLRLALPLVAAVPLLFINVPTLPHSHSPAQVLATSKWPTYEDVTDKAKLHFRHSFGEQTLSSVMEATGSGCVWFDYNNDGLLDLYVLSGRYIDGVTNHSKPDGRDATNHLFRNNGDGTFTDVTAQAGVAGKGFAMGVTVGDYDNDGYEDIYVTNWNSAILYHNNHDGTFTDVTESAGVQNNHFGVGAAFLDYDRDGRLDLFVGNYLKFDPNSKKPFYSADAFAGPLDYEGESNRLFHNNGDGTFTDVSEKAGIANPPGRAMGVTVGDYDNDGWPDIYVANDQMESYLYHNNHDGTFTNVAVEQGVAYGTNGDTPSAMGPIFADYNNDGALDLFVSDMRYQRLFRNSLKDGFFNDTTLQSGVAQITGQYVGWGDAFLDFDNDGWKDAFIVNGGLHWLVPMEPTLLRNNADGTFTDVSSDVGPAFKNKVVGRGACFADYDNDGNIDAFIVVLGGNGVLLHAKPPAGPRNHWLTLKLVGTVSNRDGFGARIEATAGELHQIVENVPQSGYLSQNDPRPHFGLGSHAEVDSLTIRWPSGTVQKLEHVKADQILTITEPGQRPAADAGGKAR